MRASAHRNWMDEAEAESSRIPFPCGWTGRVWNGLDFLRCNWTATTSHLQVRSPTSNGITPSDLIKETLLPRPKQWQLALRRCQNSAKSGVPIQMHAVDMDSRSWRVPDASLVSFGLPLAWLDSLHNPLSLTNDNSSPKFRPQTRDEPQ